MIRAETRTSGYTCARWSGPVNLRRSPSAGLDMHDARHEVCDHQRTVIGFGGHAMDSPLLQQLFVNGAYVDGTGLDTYDVTSPATGAVAGSLPVPAAADIDAAVKAANDAQPAWAAVNVWERARVCHRIGDELSKRVDELARLQTLEQGKPLAESVADVEEAAQLFHLHAEDALRLHGEVLPSSDSRKRMFTFHRAVGTWGIITPWNFPLLMLAEFVAPGLATGNAHVV